MDLSYPYDSEGNRSATQGIVLLSWMSCSEKKKDSVRFCGTPSAPLPLESEVPSGVTMSSASLPSPRAARSTPCRLEHVAGDSTSRRGASDLRCREHVSSLSLQQEQRGRNESGTSYNTAGSVKAAACERCRSHRRHERARFQDREYFQAFVSSVRFCTSLKQSIISELRPSKAPITPFQRPPRKSHEMVPFLAGKPSSRALKGITAAHQNPNILIR